MCYLVEHAGALVTKDEVLDAVWQHRFVSESVLKVCINELRRTLDDSAKTPRYIETVARRGYRFIAAPKRVETREVTPESSLLLTTPIGSVIRAAEPTHYLLQRTDPLAQLKRLLERALSGERRVVFITGEAGIGKTTVVETFLEPMAERGVGVLLGRCIEHYGAGEAFMPLLEVFDRCCRATGGSGLIARLVTGRRPAWHKCRGFWGRKNMRSCCGRGRADGRRSRRVRIKGINVCVPIFLPSFFCLINHQLAEMSSRPPVSFASIKHHAGSSAIHTYLF